MKIRPACSGLTIDEAMDLVKEIHTLDELKKELNRGCPGYYDENTLADQDYGFDNRIGWHTYLILCDYSNGEYKQQAVFFADSPISSLMQQKFCRSEKTKVFMSVQIITKFVY